MPLTIDKLIAKVTSYNPKARVDFLREAYDFAAAAHAGQKRSSGEKFITHPLGVAMILADLQVDTMTIGTSLMHDVVEDTEITMEELEAKFGQEIAGLVDGVTKLGRIEYRSKMEQQVENLRKMFLAMAKDIRVILIKLADRLHNMRTLKHLTPQKQQEIARETLEIYAPLAHRLGISTVKWEMEDLSLRYLEPETYYELVKGIAKKRADREEYINNVINILADKLTEVGLKAEIEGRPKHFYSIYRKMIAQQKELGEIYDLIAVRVLVDTVRDCYGALGMVHTLWKPIPGRFKDYIAMPKPNMYQSLHTSVMGPGGEPFEIQIRTYEMHRTAEFGIAAHWRYKEGRGEQEFDDKLTWLRQLLEWQNDMKDAREFMESLKIDVFSDVVFVFTPKGDVIELPAGSVPIDFAYRIHTNVGHRCVGGKINGKLVPLDYRLRNGDIVEVVTTKQMNGPSRDWLNLVKTSQAKNKIRAWFKKEKRDENITRGRELLEKEAKKLFHDIQDFLKYERLEKVSEKMNFPDLDDLLAAIGDGAVSAHHIITKLKEDFKKEEVKKDKQLTVEEYIETKGEPTKARIPSKTGEGVKVKGEDDVLIRLARCCNPVPGDPIIGYITRGRGVSVHRADCRNIAAHEANEEDRIIDVSWDETHQGSYHVKLEVVALDRAGLLSDVMAILSELKISADWVTARGHKSKMATIDLVLDIKSLDQLELIMLRVKQVKDVFEVKRVTPQGG